MHSAAGLHGGLGDGPRDVHDAGDRVLGRQPREVGQGEQGFRAHDHGQVELELSESAGSMAPGGRSSGATARSIRPDCFPGRGKVTSSRVIVEAISHDGNVPVSERESVGLRGLRDERGQVVAGLDERYPGQRPELHVPFACLMPRKENSRAPYRQWPRRQ